MHSLLHRQLKRLNLSETKYPDSIAEWHSLINVLSKTYAENDQDRYLHNRSIELSSRELMSLNATLIETQQQLLDAARKAGRADIAASVLHNIGNILNSANVSTALLKEHCQALVVSKLQNVVELFQAHHDSLADYLTQDEKGKRIPEYMELLVHQFNEQVDHIKSEVENVMEYLGHIKDVVEGQKFLAHSQGFTETILLSDIIQLALKISGCENGQKGLMIKTEYHYSPLFVIDKTKLLEILVNLFLNARDAVLASQVSDNRVISVVSESVDKGTKVKINVIDTGVGIAEENKVKIFSYRFTTKLNGQGIGLHTSANLAKEIGGTLSLENSTLGQGSHFSLILPVQTEKK